MEYYAHTLEGELPTTWQLLENHLKNVARLAGEFARLFEGEQWAYLAGMLHDLGKYAPDFQEYLRNSANTADIHTVEVTGKVDHSTAGAQYAVQNYGILGHLLAYVIASHHTGLLDGRSETACLESRLKKKLKPLPEEVQNLPEIRSLKLPTFLSRDSFSIAFFVRMLFSCLVDADFLDAERFMDHERANRRPSWPGNVLFHMEEALTDFMNNLPRENTQVNREREKVRQWCLEVAVSKPGLFSLTVPTGGGKTFPRWPSP